MAHRANTSRTGRFWAIGVGPGDPELLTVKAARLLEQAHVLYHAGPHENAGRAWEVIRGHLRPDQQVRVVLTEPMHAVSAAADWRTPYRPGVEEIAADCRHGLNVAFVTEGDPTLYSTAAYVWQLLAEIAPEIPIEVIPGVSSITAAAARVGWPLAQKDETLLVVPAGHHKEHLRELIQESPNVCLLKPKGAFPELLEALEAIAIPGLVYEAVYVEDLGTEREWITRDLTQAAARGNYFGLVLLRQVQHREADEGAPTRSGKVWVVGLGPGDPLLLTRQAWRVLHTADEVVGYETYLKSIEFLGLRGVFRPSPIGTEIERAAQALELARSGQRVALVSSGDAGVYGMASLLLETAGKAPGIEIEVVPGVTAATAAAAQLGAPLGHDFACISLSDLLTPWPVIEHRLESAGQGDFVVVLYNPISQRRTWQLLRARDLLLKHRPAETPVGLVTGAYRTNRSARLTTLSDLTSDGVTMETTVIIGSSRTRRIGDLLVTPRGYTDPRPTEPQAPASRSNFPGKRILEESLALIERELGPHSLPPWAFAVVRRMIHASADFEFARTLHYSSDFEAAMQLALRERSPIITDTEMVLQGIRTAFNGRPEWTLACHLNDPATPTLAEADGLTRSAAGIRLAARRHPRPLLVIGNAPTALEEALHQVEKGWRPAAILGMPVGFVGVEEAKERLQKQDRVPYLTCVGRKGGSAVAAAALNALVEYFHP